MRHVMTLVLVDELGDHLTGDRFSPWIYARRPRIGERLISTSVVMRSDGWHSWNESYHVHGEVQQKMNDDVTSIRVRGCGILVTGRRSNIARVRSFERPALGIWRLTVI
jgi:hypothetical protein